MAVVTNSLHAGYFYHAFVVVCWLFSKKKISNNSFRTTIRVSKSLEPDQGQHFVGPDLGPNCLQRLTKVISSKETQGPVQLDNMPSLIIY